MVLLIHGERRVTHRKAENVSIGVWKGFVVIHGSQDSHIRACVNSFGEDKPDLCEQELTPFMPAFYAAAVAGYAEVSPLLAMGD